MLRVAAFFVTYSLVVLFGRVAAECPRSEHNLPVWYNSTHYLGCYRYRSGNAGTAIQACFTDYKAHPEGHNESPDDPNNSFHDHALIVRPGCIVYEFSQNAYQGSVTEYSAGVYPNVQSHGKIHSIKVRCDIEHIDCQPSDNYSNVLTCDATGAVVDSECSYIKTIGTSYTESISESMSLDTSLKEEMKASFFKIFSSSLSVSTNTGYDWTQVSQDSQSDQVSFEVSATAPAGYVLAIDQAVGLCGGSHVNTELFRITQKRPDGNATVQYVTAGKGNIFLG